MTRYQRWARVEVLVPHDTYAQLKAMVPTEKVSPTIRKLVEDYVHEQQVRRRIEALRERWR